MIIGRPTSVNRKPAAKHAEISALSARRPTIKSIQASQSPAQRCGTSNAIFVTSSLCRQTRDARSSMNSQKIWISRSGTLNPRTVAGPYQGLHDLLDAVETLKRRSMTKVIGAIPPALRVQPEDARPPGSPHVPSPGARCRKTPSFTRTSPASPRVSWPLNISSASQRTGRRHLQSQNMLCDDGVRKLWCIFRLRYLELQRLRDEVRKAEMSCAMVAPYSKKTKRSALIEIESRWKMASNVA